MLTNADSTSRMPADCLIVLLKPVNLIEEEAEDMWEMRLLLPPNVNSNTSANLCGESV